MADRNIVEDAKRFIEANISVPGPREIAAGLNVEYETFRKHFGWEVGIGPGEYLMNRKVERVKHLLETTDLKCIEICRMVGFSSQSMGANVFKNRTGMTMQEYRRQHSDRNKD